MAGSEDKFEDNRNDDDEDGAAEHLRVVAGFQPGENIAAKPSISGVSGKGCGGYQLQGRGADAADDHGQCQW